MSNENRYRYLNQAGKAQGPFWLADMRRHFRDGRIGPDTPVYRSTTIYAVSTR